jgi:hypothetical protein
MKLNLAWDLSVKTSGNARPINSFSNNTNCGGEKFPRAASEVQKSLRPGRSDGSQSA